MGAWVVPTVPSGIEGQPVPEPIRTDVDEVSERLQGGIETCRSVIENYRSLLTDTQPAATVFPAEAAGPPVEGEPPG